MVNKEHNITPNYTWVEEERIIAIFRGLICQNIFAKIANKLTESKVHNSFREINNSSDSQEAAPHLCNECLHYRFLILC
jgi:hypothetical protein